MVDKELLDREMWSLSKDEADAVKKRVDTLTATLKKRKQQRADVRKFFAAPTQVGSCTGCTFHCCCYDVQDTGIFCYLFFFVSSFGLPPATLSFCWSCMTEPVELVGRQFLFRQALFRHALF